MDSVWYLKADPFYRWTSIQVIVIRSLQYRTSVVVWYEQQMAPPDRLLTDASAAAAELCNVE